MGGWDVIDVFVCFDIKNAYESAAFFMLSHFLFMQNVHFIGILVQYILFFS